MHDVPAPRAHEMLGRPSRPAAMRSGSKTPLHTTNTGGERFHQPGEYLASQRNTKETPGRHVVHALTHTRDARATRQRHEELHRAVNAHRRTRRFLEEARAGGVITTHLATRMGFAPATIAAHETAEKSFRQQMGSVPYTAKNFVTYMVKILNHPRWKSAGSCHTRAKQIRTIAKRAGATREMEDPRVVTLMASLARAMRMDPRRQARPLTPDGLATLLTALKAAGEEEITVLAILTYVLAIRLGDALRLHADEIHLDRPRPYVQMHAFKLRGSGAHGRYPLALRSRWKRWVNRWATKRNGRLLFRVEFQAALKIFDRVAPALQITGHSFRRGALQALIDAGYTASQVREVSQHKTDTALFDYLQELPHDFQDRVEDLQAAVQRVSTRPRA